MRRRRRLVSRETRGGAEARVVVLAWEPAVCACAANVHAGACLGPLWRAVRGTGWREDGGRELTLQRRPPIQSALVT